MEEEQAEQETPKFRRLAITDDALVELTRRVASGGGAHLNTRNTWSEYMLVLALASMIIDQAPQSAEEVAEMDIEQRVGEAVNAIARTLHAILPGGVMEIVSYLPEELRKKGWGQGCNW